jgi:hypothetical protein
MKFRQHQNKQSKEMQRSVGAHTCNPSAQEEGARRLQTGQPGPCNETLSLKQRKRDGEVDENCLDFLFSVLRI